MKLNNKKAFTLIELLAVIAVISLLAILAMTALNNARLKARDARRLADINNIKKVMALKLNNDEMYDYDCNDERGPANGWIYPVYTCDGLSKYINFEDLKDPSSTDVACDGTNVEGCNYAFNNPPRKGKVFLLYFYLEGSTSLGNSGPVNCVTTADAFSCADQISFFYTCRNECEGGDEWEQCKIYDSDGSGCIDANDGTYFWNNR